LAGGAQGNGVDGEKGAGNVQRLNPLNPEPSTFYSRRIVAFVSSLHVGA
jgi:hypothetical protein